MSFPSSYLSPVVLLVVVSSTCPLLVLLAPPLLPPIVPPHPECVVRSALSAVDVPAARRYGIRDRTAWGHPPSVDRFSTERWAGIFEKNLNDSLGSTR